MRGEGPEPCWEVNGRAKRLLMVENRSRKVEDILEERENRIGRKRKKQKRVLNLKLKIKGLEEGFEMREEGRVV